MKAIELRLRLLYLYKLRQFPFLADPYQLEIGIVNLRSQIKLADIAEKELINKR